MNARSNGTRSSGAGRNNTSKNGAKNSTKPGSKGASNQNGSGRKRKKNRKKPRLDPAKYWGDPATLPVRDDYTLEVKDPTAVVRSLGKAPIPGKNSAPELYFDLLYTRAAGLAQALAFAGGLNQNGVADGPDHDSPESDQKTK